MTDNERVFKKGEVIYRQNDYEMCLYDILYGSVTLYQNYGQKDEIVIKEYDGDGYFGELELVEARPRTTTAVATERTQVRGKAGHGHGDHAADERPHP